MITSVIYGLELRLPIPEPERKPLVAPPKKEHRVFITCEGCDGCGCSENHMPCLNCKGTGFEAK